MKKGGGRSWRVWHWELGVAPPFVLHEGVRSWGAKVSLSFWDFPQVLCLLMFSTWTHWGIWWQEILALTITPLSDPPAGFLPTTWDPGCFPLDVFVVDLENEATASSPPGVLNQSQLSSEVPAISRHCTSTASRSLRVSRVDRARTQFRLCIPQTFP